MNKTRESRQYSLRQLKLDKEYQKKLKKVKLAIAHYSGEYPNLELTIGALIDEFLNVHGIDVDDLED